MIPAQRPGAETPDRHLSQRTGARRAMTESIIAKKLSGIPPLPVHSHHQGECT
jgi:hypothetical protein